MSIVTASLGNGLVVGVEPMPGVMSASITWLIPVGAARDPEGTSGMSAVIAEMLMRGAGGLDSRAQADAADRIGLTRRVSPGGRQMVIGGTVLGASISDGLSLLADIVVRPNLSEDALEPSRDLCLMEIESLRDDPQERAVLAARQRHAPPPFDSRVEGTVDGIGSINHADLVAHWNRSNLPGGSYIGIAGNVDPDAVIKRLEDLTSGWSGRAKELTPGKDPTRGYLHENDESNQVQVVLIHDAPSERSPDRALERFAISVLSGGMSGRLFVEVREKRGLCYSVSASYATDRDFGRVLAYVGTTPERAQESLDVLVSELARLRTREGAVTEQEFTRTRTRAVASLVFAGESTAARAGAIASDLARLGAARTLEQYRQEVESVTLAALNDYVARRRIGRATIQTLGPSPLTPPNPDEKN